jgi:rubrerythrin
MTANITRADNTSRSFKCSTCGATFATKATEAECPICGNTCSAESCQVIDASDEDY